ncbi:putative sulfate exporter family transporter [Streptomyces sp. NBC_01267]|uniref:YeiH family protein n=1 Tax=unclassified Streptomyces TaxID=2593676 RepID=UPI002024C46A|nr:MULTISPECIES: putative sulfate exporter family transporter [unclassified Streptomyces]MCX4549184.1 putative sulfate exporter family transporter [Streptomyces sp. NBC_01500]WSV54782.1 putative sulfate exporter family transporter [Streptomyces sp. NBC_01014]
MATHLDRSPLAAPRPPGPPTSGRRASAVAAVRRNAPGLALAVVGVVCAEAVHALLPGIPMLTAAVVLGIVAAHVPGLRTRVRGPAQPGLTFAGKRLMRAGVVLLGLKLSIGDVLGLGWATVVMILGVVAATFFGTQWLGRKMGLPGEQPLLVATGYAICGASAIGAVSSVLDRNRKQESAEETARRDSDVAAAVALVTLCGTLAIAVLPLLQGPLGLDASQFGRWVGAGVHDVGQVVATAQTAGPDALGEAVMVKLIRVAMLAPLVAGVALARRRQDAKLPGADAAPAGRRPPLVPLFVAGFLAAVALRSTGWLPGGVLDAADNIQELLLAAALFGLGSAVYLPTLARSGVKLAALGLASWVIVAVTSLAGVLLTT